MQFTAAASWLNNTFAGFDNGILEFMHTLEGSAGAVLTPLAKFITLIGEKGLLMFLLAFVFMFFPRTRKLGVCMFGAVCCGALITNVILKDLIGRPRPFEAMAPFMRYWKAVGSPAEDGFSFPSGHVTAAAAGMAAIMFVKGKKFILPSALYVFLMCFSRNYLMAHYPSDVLAASIVGLFSGFVAYLIASFIFEYCEDNDDLPFFSFILNFSLPLPNLSGLINRINRVPNRNGKDRSEKKRSASHVSTKENSARASKSGSRRSSRATKISVDDDDADDFNFTVDMDDELLSDAALESMDSSEPEEEIEKPSRRARSEKAAAPAMLNSVLSGAKAKAANLVKKPRAAVKSSRTSAVRAEAEPASISIHTSELDFDFASASSSKKQERPTSDWNARWEEYRARRDQAQVKTAPAQQGSAQMEFENIFGKNTKAEEAPSTAAENTVKAEDELNSALSVFNEPHAGGDPEEDVKEYKPASKGGKRPVVQAEPLEEKPLVEKSREPVKMAEPVKAEEPAKAEASKDSLESFDHIRRRPSTNTGSIDLDMDEIYSLLNGSYDFSRD